MEQWPPYVRRPSDLHTPRPRARPLALAAEELDDARLGAVRELFNNVNRGTSPEIRVIAWGSPMRVFATPEYRELRNDRGFEDEEFATLIESGALDLSVAEHVELAEEAMETLCSC